MKPEDEDEKIVNWGRRLIRAEKGDMDVYLKWKSEGRDVHLLTKKYDSELAIVQKEAASQVSKYSAIFQCAHACRFLETILRLSAHFQATKHLRITGLAPITDVHGGVSTFMFSKVPYTK